MQAQAQQEGWFFMVGVVYLKSVECVSRYGWNDADDADGTNAVLVSNARDGVYGTGAGDVVCGVNARSSSRDVGHGVNAGASAGHVCHGLHAGYGNGSHGTHGSNGIPSYSTHGRNENG